MIGRNIERNSSYIGIVFCVRRKYVGIRHHRELSSTLTLHDIGGEG
jgi:hypothetical protein